MIPIQSRTLPNILDQSPNSIFFAKPEIIRIDEHVLLPRDVCSKNRCSEKIELLIQKLKEKGPLVASAQIGPSLYADAPFKLKHQMCDQDIYGWQPNAKRTDDPKRGYIIILGAKKTVDCKYVYFTLSENITQDEMTFIREHRREHQPSSTDTKIYVTSLKTFRDHLHVLFDVDLPPTRDPDILKEASSRDTPFDFDPYSRHTMPLGNAPNKKLTFCLSSYPKSAPTLSSSQQQYAIKLSSIMPLDSILDEAEGESKCKAIGQEIFEKYKKEAGGSSIAGEMATRKICDSIAFIAQDGHLRKQYIERAWDGIGDAEWRWRA